MRILIAILISLTVVSSGYSQGLPKAGGPKVHKVIVQQVLQSTNYTYLKVKEDTTLSWIAIPKMEASYGDVYYTAGGMEMHDFQSKELNRTFPVIFFMDFVSKTPEGAIKKETAVMPADHKSMPEHGAKPKITRKDVKFDPIPGGISIAELYKNRSKYEGKVVKLRGQIVKYNENIMGKTWIHLQDGTKDGEDYDLVITLAGTAELGSKVSIKGKIALNKDFGSGYSFPVLMEEAEIIK